MSRPAAALTGELYPLNQVWADFENRFERFLCDRLAFCRVHVQEADESFKQVFRAVAGAFQLVDPLCDELLRGLANRLFSVAQTTSEHSLALFEREGLWRDLGEDVREREPAVRGIDVERAAKQGGQGLGGRDQVEQSSTANLAAGRAPVRWASAWAEARQDLRSRVMIQHVDEDLGDASLGFLRSPVVAVVLVRVAVVDFLVCVLQFREGDDGMLANRRLLVTHPLEERSFERPVRLVAVQGPDRELGVLRISLREAQSSEGVLDLAEAVDHEGDELHAAVPRDLVLGLEAPQQEREKLCDEAGCGTVVGIVILTSTGCFALLEVCKARVRT